jgi:hypothetical protein
MSLMHEPLVGGGVSLRFPLFSLLCKNDLKPWAMLVGTCGTVCLPLFTNSERLGVFLDGRGDCDPDIVEFDTAAELINFLCYQQREIHVETVIIDPTGPPAPEAQRLPVEDLLQQLRDDSVAVQA